MIIGEAVEKALGYEFKDRGLLQIALTHKSIPDPKDYLLHGSNNERLEFLGDAVLSLVAANFLYRENGGRISEGDLSRMRAQFVCQENLSLAAKKIDLGDHIISDKAVRASGSTNSKSMLADTLEAIFGAIYLDGGLVAAQQAIFQVLGVPSTSLNAASVDPKTKLQELVQAMYQDAPRYVVLKKTGPAHSPTFEIGVEIRGEIAAVASGENKKMAAQNAAVMALAAFSATNQDAKP